ncbi:hypothetical protein GCM10017778_32220 [Streptomyces vinaceus]|nr:hypothetical protein GCM10017778_32220 [Streptomyces vinaceus]
MSATMQAGAFLVCEADDGAAATAPLDTTVVSESVSIVLEPREYLIHIPAVLLCRRGPGPCSVRAGGMR